MEFEQVKVPAWPSLSRRDVLAGALAASACRQGDVSSIPAHGRRAPVADVHAHFFNLADLPVSGFTTYVLIGQYFPPPAWAEAMIDFITGFAKQFARSARREAATLGRPDELDAPGFGRRAADYVDAVMGAAPASSGADDTLRRSYDALLRDLTTQTGVPAPDAALTLPAASLDTRRAAFTRAARLEELDETVAASGGINPVSAVGDVARTIGWAYLMTQSRQTHVERYLARQRSDDREPRAMVSLLVDYDYWLGDAPAAGSGQMDQILTMGLLRHKFTRRTDLRIFAGICPLRLAVQRATGQPALFDRIKAAHTAGQVHGFKFYPPMGFRATGNAELDNSDFDPPPVRRRTAWDRWREETGNSAPGSLGLALDAALAEVYAYAAAHQVPIVAHAGPGNGAAKGFGERANPKYWERVVGQHNVRLSLGHLVNDAGPFIEAVLGHGSHEGIWSLGAPVRMMNRNQSSPPDVYGDLAYMPELNDEVICRKFFTALAQTFAPGDPKLERILYGTDWIMYAREPRSDSYLRNVERGMRGAGYSGEQIDNILWANAQRFLGVA